MKIEVGGVYKTRDGDRVEITDKTRLIGFKWRDDDGNWYTDEGYQEGDYPHSNNPKRDLIAHWHDDEYARVDSNKEWMENSPTPEVGEWVGWNGGECPVHPETVVDGVEEGGAIWNGCAAKYNDWNSFRGAYRIITPYVEPKKSREFWVDDVNLLAYRDDMGDNLIHVREVLDDD